MRLLPFLPATCLLALLAWNSSAHALKAKTLPVAQANPQMPAHGASTALIASQVNGHAVTTNSPKSPRD